MKLTLGRTFTGAWIETLATIDRYAKVYVAPLRVRGLKHQYSELAYRQTIRRTFTGAWIETGLESLCTVLRFSRTFTGAWIETKTVVA